MKLNREEEALKARLDTALTSFDEEAFIAADPVQFPRRYARREDKEIAAFLAAAIAWGRREIIIRSAERIFALMGESPWEFVMKGDYNNFGTKSLHRTFFPADLVYYCRAFRDVYEKYPSLEDLFLESLGEDGVWAGFARFREGAAKANGGLYSKHISAPASACKRLNLALRWLVRGEPVDTGSWKRLRPADLCIPLDVRTARAARDSGLLLRKSNDRKAVEELTGKLKTFCPEDPVKYDFALFMLGQR